jgi:hypothetical protein
MCCGGLGRRSVMTILQKPSHSGDGHAGKRRYKFGHAAEAVRHTEAWEHETFAEEQARWERSDPAYARICEQVRRARREGEEASRRADQAKAEWDARVATQRQANDAAQNAPHALKSDQTARRRTATSRTVWSSATGEPCCVEHTDVARGDPRSGRLQMQSTFAIESSDSPAPGIIPEPVRVKDEPTAPTRRPGPPSAGRATEPLSSVGQRNPVSIMLAKLLGVIRGDKYMVDAYPPAWHSDSATRDGDGLARPNHDGALQKSVQSAAPPEPSAAERAAPAESRTRQR